MQTSSRKGMPCWIKPILCQEGYCQDCQIYLDYKGYERTMGRTTYGSITPRWLEAQEKEQADKIATLRSQIQAKRDDAFNNSLFGSLEHQLQLQSMVNAYDVVLNLIKKALGGKNESI